MNFVVIGSPRTGSTHLTHLLNNRSDVICHGEIFRTSSHSGRLPLRWDREERHRKARLSPERTRELSTLRERDPQAFLAEVFAQNEDGASVGFKIFSGQNDVMLDLLVLDSSIRKIILFRRNILAVYSSALITRASGRHRSKGSEHVPVVEPAIAFRAGQFERFCEAYLSFYRHVFGRLNTARQPAHLVNYDEINDPWHFATLISFIGVQRTDEAMEAHRVKRNSPDILSRFSNPEEVLPFLQRHGLAAWQYEMETSLDALQNRERTCSQVAHAEP